MKFKPFHNLYVGKIYRDGNFYRKVTKVSGPFFDAEVLPVREPWIKKERPLPWDSKTVVSMGIITR
jgi:hypothetical protein